MYFFAKYLKIIKNFFSLLGFFSVAGVLLLNYSKLYRASSVLFVIGLISIYAMVFVWQREKDNMPRNRFLAFVILVALIIGFIVLFAGGYQISSNYNQKIYCNIDKHKCDIKRPIDFLYYSTITATSLGFGDMVPEYNSTLVKILTMLEIIFGPILIIAIVSINFTGSDQQKIRSDINSSIERGMFDDLSSP